MGFIKTYRWHIVSFIVMFCGSLIATQVARYTMPVYSDASISLLLLIYLSVTLLASVGIGGWLIPLQQSERYRANRSFFDNAPVDSDLFVRLYFRIPVRMYPVIGFYLIALSVLSQPDLTSWVRIGLPLWSAYALGFSLMFCGWVMAWRSPSLVRYFILFIPCLMYFASVSLAVFFRMLPFSAAGIFGWALLSSIILPVSYRAQIWQNKMLRYQEEKTRQVVAEFQQTLMGLRSNE